MTREINVLIVDNNKTFAVEIMKELDAIHTFSINSSYCSGRGAIKAVGRTNPEIIIIDHFNTDITPKGLFNKIKASKILTKIIFIIINKTTIILDADVDFEALYLNAADPFAVKTAFEIAMRKTSTYEKAVRFCVFKIAREIGLEFNHMGYNFLKDAVYLNIIRPGHYQTFKAIKVDVAKLHPGSDDTTVGSDIYFVIKKLFDEKAPYAFGLDYGLKDGKERPNCNQFINALVNRVLELIEAGEHLIDEEV